MRFQSKLILLTLAVLAVLTLVISTTVFRSQQQVHIRLAAEKLIYLASSLTRGLDRLIFERQADIRFLSGDPVFTEQPLEPARITRRLIRHRDIYGFYSSLSYFDMERKRLADTEGKLLGERHPPTEYWPALERGEDLVVVLDWSSTEQRAAIHFAAAVRKDNEPVGVVVSRVPLDGLLLTAIRDVAPGEVLHSPLSTDLRDEETFDIAILDRKGIPLFVSDRTETKQQAISAAWSRIQPVLASGTLMGTLLVEDGDDGSSKKINGFARMSGHRDFAGLGWTTLIQMPTRVALAELENLRDRLFLVLLFIAASSIVAVCYFSRRVTRPLSRLSAAASAIHRGDLDARADIESRDEFGQLAETFNAMVSELQRNRQSLIDFNRQLERKVDERTGELNASKQQLETELAEREKMQEALADSREYLEKIINTVADPIFVKNEEFRLILVNDSFCRFVGRSCKDLIGKNDYELVPRPEADLFRANDQMVLTTGKENISEEQVTIGETTSTIITKKALHTDRLGRRYVVGIFRDVTDQTMARQRLEESEERFRAIAETASDALILTNEEGRVVYWNPAAEKIFGYAEQEILGRALIDCIPEKGRTRHEKGMEMMSRAGSHPMIGRRFETTGLHRDGRTFPIELSVNSWTIKGVRHFSAIVRDISDRRLAERALRESEERFRQIAENIREVFWMTDPGHTEQIYISPAYEEIWGRSRKSWYEDPLSWFEAIHPEDRERVQQASRAREVAGDFDEEFRIIRPDGEIRWIHDRAYPIRNEEGDIYRIVGIAEDITEGKQLEKELQQLLLRDELTGLYNRRGFMTLAEQQLKTAQRKRRHLSISFIDLDNMKWINDHQGHQAGDEALKQTARLLGETFRESDIIARMGGDEFAVAAIDTDEAGARRQAERLQEMVAQLNAGREFSFTLALSIGTAAYEPENPESLERLITRADHRMYQQKQRKKPQTLP